MLLETRLETGGVETASDFSFKMLATSIIAATAIIGGFVYAFRKLNLHHTVFKNVSFFIIGKRK